MELNYNKEIYTTPELLKEVSIARAVFFRYQKDWIVKGRCPTEMGKYTLKGSKRSYWLIRKFMSWLIQYQVNEKKTFNNEVRDQEIAIGVLKRFKNEQK
tara:strand:- start:630 stop:926 length:297 start_codon:yes stop_codon:yes gene_type:complete